MKKEIYGDAVVVATSISQICSTRRGGESHMHTAATRGFFKTFLLAFVTTNGGTVPPLQFGNFSSEVLGSGFQVQQYRH